MKRKLWIAYLLLLWLVLGCVWTKPAQVTPASTATPIPTSTATAAQTVPTQIPATPAATAPKPTGTPQPAARTPTPAARTPTPIPLPDAGPLPAIWRELDFARTQGLNPLYISDIAVDPDRDVAYLLSTCQADRQPCISTLDLRRDRVLDTSMARGGPNRLGKLVPAGDTLFLHYPGVGGLYALDPKTLAVRETISDVYGLAHDADETTYLVTERGLTRLAPGAPLVPVARKYDDAPAALAASSDRVYVLGYNTLQVFDAGLEHVATLDLEDGQLRAMTLDARNERLYVGDYDGLYLLDTATLDFRKTPAPVLGVRAMVLDPAGTTLYALAYRHPNWFQTNEVVAIDTRTWQVEALLQVNNGRLSDIVYDRERDRLLVSSTIDHALIPIDLGTTDVEPRIPVGVEVGEVIVDGAAGRLYVSESSGWVHVLDRETYDQLGRLYGGRHIGLDASRGLLYAGDARLPEVTAFDTTSLQARHTLPQPGRPRPNPATGEVVVVNRRFYVLDGESGELRGHLLPGVGDPPQECPGCYYPIAVEVFVDAGRGLTATTTYLPWPGKPGPQESIDYDPASGRAYYTLLTGGDVHYA